MFCLLILPKNPKGLQKCISITLIIIMIRYTVRSDKIDFALLSHRCEYFPFKLAFTQSSRIPVLDQDLYDILICLHQMNIDILLLSCHHAIYSTCCRDEVETLFALLAAFGWGIYRLPVHSQHKDSEIHISGGYFDVSLDKLSNKRSSFWWFESLWRLCDPKYR